MNIKEKLAVIQQELNVPKSKPNKFGGYKYRNVDMIVAAVKPLLKEQKCILTLNDEVVEVGGRVYVKATAVIEETDGDGGVGVNGWAREQLERKKSDDSQLTGAASTYARKRALEGLFLLDDSGDVTDPDEYEEDACNQKDCLYLSDHAGNQNCDEYTSSFYQPGLHQNNYKQRVQQWNYRSYDRFLI